jgi:propane monooxygenase coupling protein
VTDQEEAGMVVAHAASDTVGISLMRSAETEAAVELIRDELPDARISFRDCYYKIERAGLIEFDMEKLGERVGREIDTDLFLVNMSSYYGRMVVSDGKIQIFAEILPERFRDLDSATPDRARSGSETEGRK